MAAAEGLQATASATQEGTVVSVGGFKLNVIDKGQGTAVLMLHGFPSKSSLWKHQISFLVDHSYRAIVPDLLGYGGSDKPQEVEPYTLDRQVALLKGLLTHLRVEKAVVVGHDWGSALAWHFAGTAPERTLQLVAMSVGHPAQYFATGEQQQLSWYMLVLLTPGVGEKVLCNGSLWAKCTPPSQFFQFATDEFKDMFSDLANPGYATAGINWYRANISAEKMVAGYITHTPAVKADTLMIWPTGDRMVCSETSAKGSEAFVQGKFRYERVECDSHFLTWFAPDKVNHLLLEFLTKG